MWRKIAMIIFTIWILLLPIIHSTVPSSYARGIDLNISSPSYSLETNELVYWRPGGLWIIDQSTQAQSFYFAYEPPENGYFTDMALNRTTQQLYVSEIQGEPYGFLNRDGRIVQIDISTGIRRVLWEGLNLRFFSLSPDKTQMIIAALLAYSEDNANRPTSTFCILTIATGNCQDITETLPLHVIPSWVDDDTLYYWKSGYYLADINTLEWNVLPTIDDWVFDNVEFLPNRILFINAYHTSDSTERYFLELDLTTMELSQFPARPRLSIEGALSLSPNQQLLIYAATIGPTRTGAGSGEQDYDILNLLTGHYFTVILNNLNCCMQWFPNSLGVIGVSSYADINSPSFNTQVETENRLLYIDVNTEQVITLGSYRAPIFQPVFVLSQQ